MNFLKSVFISAYITCLSLAVIYSLQQLLQQGWHSPWPGVLVATGSALLFFILLFLKPVARTSAGLKSFFRVSVAGAAFAFLLANRLVELTQALVLGAGLGVVAQLVYIRWYSKLGRVPVEALTVGKPLPEFALQHSDGRPWQSSNLDSPALLLFYRGNWCPLCMAQIREVADAYRQLESMGVEVYMVSPQPERQTQKLASKFAVHFNFMVDKDNAAATQLGIAAPDGTPKGLEVLGYDSDTVLPTVLATDAEGKILFSDQTDNYRVRPEPETFINIFAAGSSG